MGLRYSIGSGMGLGIEGWIRYGNGGKGMDQVWDLG